MGFCYCFLDFIEQDNGIGILPNLLGQLSAETRTMIFYESPRRLVKTLEQFVQVFGPDRQCSVAREISKFHEEHHRGTIADVLSHFEAEEPKGEIVIVVAGLPLQEKREHRNKYKDYEDTSEEIVPQKQE